MPDLVVTGYCSSIAALLYSLALRGQWPEDQCTDDSAQVHEFCIFAPQVVLPCLIFGKSEKRIMFRETHRFFIAIFCSSLLVTYSNAFAQSRGNAEAGAVILHKVETYKPPPFPSDASSDREPYDYRIRDLDHVPPTLTDVFICDIWVSMAHDLQLKGISPRRVAVEDVSQTLDFYLNTRWTAIRGYRPWTHKNFIQSLNEMQRRTLSREVVKYMANYGVRE